MSEPLMYEAGGFSAFRDKWKGAGHSKLPVGGGGGGGSGGLLRNQMVFIGNVGSATANRV